LFLFFRSLWGDIEEIGNTVRFCVRSAARFSASHLSFFLSFFSFPFCSLALSLSRFSTAFFLIWNLCTGSTCLFSLSRFLGFPFVCCCLSQSNSKLPPQLHTSISIHILSIYLQFLYILRKKKDPTFSLLTTTCSYLYVTVHHPPPFFFCPNPSFVIPFFLFAWGRYRRYCPFFFACAAQHDSRCFFSSSSASKLLIPFLSCGSLSVFVYLSQFYASHTRLGYARALSLLHTMEL